MKYEYLESLTLEDLCNVEDNIGLDELLDLEEKRLEVLNSIHLNVDYKERLLLEDVFKKGYLAAFCKKVEENNE